MRGSMKKKAMALVALLCAGTVAMAGCGNTTSSTAGGASAGGSAAQASNGSQINLTFWHSMGGTNGDALQSMVDEFNKENEGKIKVTEVYQGNYDDALNKFKSAMLAKQGPDVMQSYELGTRYMIDSGFTETIQDWAEKDNWDLNQIDTNIAAYYTVDGKLQSMPFNSSTPILYYNKDIFKEAGITEAPKTFQEIVDLAPKLTKKDSSGNTTQNAIGMYVYGWWMDESLNKMGLPSFDNGNGREKAPTKVMFDSNGGGARFLSAYHKLITSGAMPTYAMKDDSGQSAFVNGKLAMYVNSTASLAGLLKAINGKFELGAAYFPAVDDSSVSGGVSIGGASLWMMKDSDQAKQQAKWEFIKFLASPKEQAIWNTKTGYFPINVKACDEQTFKDNVAKYPQFQVAIDQLHDSKPENAGALCAIYTQARKIEETEIQKVCNNQESESDALKSMADQINSALKDYNDANS